jgi:hypothetical protein
MLTSDGVCRLGVSLWTFQVLVVIHYRGVMELFICKSYYYLYLNIKNVIRLFHSQIH